MSFLPTISFPEALPVSGKRDEIKAAMAAHQVIIVCGETGSGKTTQLPKIALSLGRGACNYPAGQRARLIGHTQPRRIAASSVARRIAEELKTPLGEVVGYKVRFQDRLSRGASVKLMTDGILLAETQTDPLLNAYDTLIIDEAHERSLNIDFLLGYIKQILPRRPDLKIVVTSATIDAERFARHFASRPAPGCPKSGDAPPGGSDPHAVGERGGLIPAPVITVSGRMFPVEQRYRPFEDSRDYGLNDAIADAVDELWRDAHHQGDILVFLPGEREIREAADHLRRHLAHNPITRNAEVLPLFARLSQSEQDRIFDGHTGRRIVLATNVAETSLTVPGIQYVVDAGTARVKRYSFRSKVEQLLVEPISQAAANQRAGRCGRVANGICIRLYDEKDFAGRERFTTPEILRSSLAGVILRMKALHLGAVEDFPFLEAPTGRAIADGYQLLGELGAVDEANQLTPLGQELSRLPLDPRVGRMLLEARSRAALDEVLVIAAALSVQDVRDRPMEAQQQADTAHKKFDDEKSEFAGYLKLWKWIHDVRGGREAHKLSNRQYEALLRQNFVNVRRVREWKDIHSQLLTVVTEHQWKVNTTPATYEQLHLSVLAGLLGNIGCRLDEAQNGEYLGARAIKFFAHPGAHLSKKPGKWIVASELVETTRLFGRGIAHIEPQWLEQVGGHLLKTQLLDPHWEKRVADVVALERATLYGLVVYSGRKRSYGRYDPAAARAVFIREALVAGDWDTPLPFLAANLKLVAQVEELEHKARRQDVLVDDAVIVDFYDQQLPSDVYNGATLERWYRAGTLLLTREALMRHEAASVTASSFPRMLRLGGVDCACSYLHEPGDASDGLTVTLPLVVLNQASEERCEWLVPGMLKDKLLALLKTLSQRQRSRLVPLPETAAQLAAQLTAPQRFAHGNLLDVLAAELREHHGLVLTKADFKPDQLVLHHTLNIRLVDEHGRQLAQGRNLAALKAAWGSQARGAFQALAALQTRTIKPSQPLPPSKENRPATPVQSVGAASKTIVPMANSQGLLDAAERHNRWDFGALPELLEIRRGGQTLVGFPALVDEGDAVRIEVFDEPDAAARQHRCGLQRLVTLQIRDALRHLEKNLPDLRGLSLAALQLGGSKEPISLEQLRQDVLALATERAFLQPPLPDDAASFERRLQEGRTRLALIANEVARLASGVLTEHVVVQRKLREGRLPPDTVADCAQQLTRLLPRGFLASTPWERLQQLPRYLKGVALRLDKCRADPARDAARLAEVRPLEQRAFKLLAQRKGVPDARLDDYCWMLQELRISLFAQELRTPQPVSVKRLEKAWAQLQG